MSAAELLTMTTVTHQLDYGYFTITGSDDASDDLALLDAAQAEPPSTSDGSTVLVLSPHQNNFAMKVAVQLWSGEPLADSDDWEQVSVERLRVDASSAVRLTSPTLPSTTCAIPQGDYWVEASGRGFTNYGWPGSTEPGDQWRLRFWPGEAPVSRPSKLWSMPGYGTPWDDDTLMDRT